jgi:hypothetical protein
VPVRRCLTCGALFRGASNRCPEHRATTRTAYGAGERRRRKATVDIHVEAYGAVCPGWHVPMHTVDASDLTADHVQAIAAGGAPGGLLEVLCRSCNGRKADRQETRAWPAAAAPASPPR